MYLKRRCVGDEPQGFAKFFQLRPFKLHSCCQLSMKTLRAVFHSLDICIQKSVGFLSYFDYTGEGGGGTEDKFLAVVSQDTLTLP